MEVLLPFPYQWPALSLPLGVGGGPGLFHGTELRVSSCWYGGSGWVTEFSFASHLQCPLYGMYSVVNTRCVVYRAQYIM